jgi:hypothetical protein
MGNAILLFICFATTDCLFLCWSSPIPFNVEKKTGKGNESTIEKSKSIVIYITILKYNTMQTIDLIHEIQRLPLTKRFYVVEETLKSIKKEEMSHQMELAANELYSDYVNDKELTAFTALDLEHFYETK